MSSIDFIELGEEYDPTYKTAFDEVSFENEKEQESFRLRIFDLQDRIRKELETKWKYMDDWEVSHDFNYQYHVCGGIYSYKIFSFEYVERLVRIINSVPEPEKWTYHTSCEILDEDDNLIEVGEFFIRDNKVYFPSDDIDYMARLKD